MLYSTGAPEHAGGAQPVGSAAAATQWIHTVPRQMPWTVPPAQRPFSRTGPINSGSFLRQHAPPIPQPETAPIVASVGYAANGPSQIGHPVNLPHGTGSPATIVFNDKALAGHTVTGSLSRESVVDPVSTMPYNAQANQTMAPLPTVPAGSDGGIGLTKIPPSRQSEASQQLVIYPGDPCTSSAPQGFGIACDTAVSGPANGPHLSALGAQRQPFPSTSYCAPRFKRKLRTGLGAPDGGTLSSSDESSDAVGGKIFVTERMVARMGDLSLCDRHQGGQCEIANSQAQDQQKSKIGPMDGASAPTLQGSTVSGEARTRVFSKGELNSPAMSRMSSSLFPLSKVDSAASQRYSRFGDFTEDLDVDYGGGSESNSDRCGSDFMSPHMLLEDKEQEADSEDRRALDSPLLICSGVKATIGANASIEQRLALDMMKKSTMAVVLWSPLKAQLHQPTATTSTPAGPSNFDKENEMEQQESDSASPDGRVPLTDDLDGLSGSVSSMTEDIMEVM